jgi:hypothetical protein
MCRRPLVDPEPAPLASAEPAMASFWALKPWWCQPWTIVATGLLVVALSWLALGIRWISLPLALGVLAWWGLFLLLVPAAWRAEQQEAQGESQR